MTSSDPRQLVDRARLARELHDGIAQDLVGVGYSLDLLLANPGTSMEARSQLRTLRFTVTDMIDKVRREIFYLRQPSTITLAQGIKEAAKEHCRDLELQLSIDEASPTLEPDLSYEIQRIAQEILRNVSLHAHAQNVSVSLINKKEAIELRIVDDGVGGASPSAGHYGIQSIYDRTAAINGVVDIKSDSDGTSVFLQIPIMNYASE